MSRSVRRLAWAVVVAIGVGVGMVAFLGIRAGVSLILALAVAVLATLPLAQRLRRGDGDLLEPIVGGVVTLGVMFGMRPIAMLIDGGFTYRGIDIAPQFPTVIALGLLGTGAFVASYEWARARELRATPSPSRGDPTRRLDGRLAYGYIGILAVLSVALFALNLSRIGTDVFDGFRLLAAGTSPELSTRWTGTTEYLSASPILAACGATLLGIVTRWRLGRYRLVLLVALVAYPVVIFYLAGDRRYILPSLGIPLVAWMLMSAVRPGRRLLIGVVLIGFLVLATIPFVRWAAARSESGGLTGALTQGFQNPGLAIQRFVLGPDTGMVPALAVEVKVLSSPGDFFYGRATFGDLLLAPIPHIVFPGKPQTARDEMLTRSFGAPCNVSVGGVCDDFSIVGTFYQDFWVPGVIVLMGVVGGALAVLWFRWRRSRDSPLLVACAATWVVFVPIMFRAGFMPAFGWSLYFLVPLVIGIVLIVPNRTARRWRREPKTG